ncbi:ST8SIA4 [Branchiostoma lanceolatum]|uniref:ST8SIA4 protein n=1 Tax=Branchiostoma lanceolatum TaxID=7740 RepID=A0A8J9Z0A4_BRALA|nr:ST8SIA4 [Branchiostoma lanceolatum]
MGQHEGTSTWLCHDQGDMLQPQRDVIFGMDTTRAICSDTALPVVFVEESQRTTQLKVSKVCRLSFKISDGRMLRKWVMTYYNPDTDLSVIKSQVRLGQQLKYEQKTQKKFKIDSYFYRLIPKSQPLLGKHFRSCAVVGNSGILFGSRCGPQIDSADFVFRSNLAAIEGFENDVGTKSNFTTMNPSVLPHDYNGYEKNYERKEKFINRLRLIQDQILHIPAFVSHGRTPATQFTNMMIVKRHLPIKLSYGPRNTNAKITAVWNDSEFKPKVVSTGNFLFSLAACLCDQIHMYGFYPFPEDEKGRKIKYHYYGNIGNLPKHEMPEEYRAYLTFHQRKALVLHTEPCNDDKL